MKMKPRMWKASALRGSPYTNPLDGRKDTHKTHKRATTWKKRLAKAVAPIDAVTPRTRSLHMGSTWSEHEQLYEIRYHIFRGNYGAVTDKYTCNANLSVVFVIVICFIFVVGGKMN